MESFFRVRQGVMFGKTQRWVFVIWGFRREVDKNRHLLAHYSASSGHSLLTYLDILSVPCSRIKNPVFNVGFLTSEDGTDLLSRNVGKELPLLDSQRPRRLAVLKAACCSHETSFLTQLFVCVIPNIFFLGTVIPRLTSDPANEFFG